MAKAKRRAGTHATTKGRKVRAGAAAAPRLAVVVKERDEALEQQAATADILRVISGSPSDMQPVLQAVAEAALRLCRASDVFIRLVDGELMPAVVHVGAIPLPVETKLQRISRKTAAGRAILDCSFVQVPDTAHPSVREEYSDALFPRQTDQFRSLLVVPLARERRAIGTITIRRTEVGPFSEPQIKLLQTFADQAVIAIENARLFNETKEALEKQTATADILQVLSGSPSNTQPVFDAIVRHAARLCESSYANVFRYDGERIHLAASEGGSAEALLALRNSYPAQPSPARVVGRVIQTGRAQHVEDTMADAGYDRAFAGTLRLRRILGVPLLRGAKPVGAITVAWAEPGPISERHQDLLKTFADQAVIAIENVRLFNETKEALERQTATADILKVISSSPTDTKPVLDAIARSAAQLFDPCNVGITLLEADRLHLRAMAGPRVAQISLQEIAKVYPLPFDPDTVASAKAILERRVLEFTDMESQHTSPVTRRLAPIGKFRSAVIVPLIREGEGIGTIAITHPEPGFKLDDKQLALLKTFADQAVIAIQNARLFNETREALDQQKASAEVLGAISGSIADTKPVFEKILASCERLFEGELVGITLADGDTVRLAAYHGPQGEQLKNVYPLPLTRESGTGWAILNAKIAHFADIEGAGVPPGVVAGCRTLRVRAIVFAPMLFEGKGIGAIWVARAQPGAFTDKQIAQLRTFADQAVIAIQNARLVNETREALDQLKASADVLGVISSSIADTRPVFDTILQSCERLFAGTLVGINILGDDGLVRIGAYHGPNREAFEKVFPIPVDRESGTGLAVIERRVLHYPDIEADGVPPATMRGCRATGIRSVIFAPMLWEEKGVGAIFVGREHVGQFSDKEISLLKTFADQAVIAIQNARLFREIQEKSAQLEVANKHKSDFLANMSHELRTPLNAIIGFSEVLSERMFGEVNDKQAEYLKDIHESGRHLLSLINDILDLSKIEAGRMELELSSFHLPTAVSNAMTLIRERAQRHGIALGVAMDPALGEFQADERKVKQILLNLLSNAVKFTPDGGRVDVTATAVNGRIEIAVRDTGIGIAPEDHAAVFEEFKQVGRDYTRKAEGTGLGLALTKRLVELHGGQIALESAPGKGSTFTVRLPLR